MSRTTALALSTRIGIGIAGLALGAAAIAAPAIVDAPVVDTGARGVSVVPVATDTTRVCAGPFLDADDPDAITSFDGTVSAFEVVDGGAPVQTALTVDDPSIAPGTGTATSYTVPAESSEPLPAGAALSAISSETYGGFAASSCVEPSAESWLVSGSSDVGRTSLIVLSNASAVPSTVDLTIYGESGPVAAAGSTGILIPAGTERIVPLSGLAPNIIAPVVHVSSRGGEIAASMQSSVISGLTPFGIENSPSSVAPADAVTIPGVVLSTQSEVPSSDDVGVTSDQQSAVRIVAPGDVDANVTVEVRNDDPTGTGTSATTVIPADSVVEVPLSGLADGSYTVVVSADAPVTAAVRTSSTGTVRTDLAWYPSTSALTGSFYVATVETDAVTALHLSNTGAAVTEVGIVREDGSRQDLSIGTGQAAAVDLTAGRRVLVETTGELRASVSLVSDGGGITSYPINPANELAGPITVYSY